jgi:hypothetical protein
MTVPALLPAFSLFLSHFSGQISTIIGDRLPKFVSPAQFLALRMPILVPRPK